jgi:hypothetical protein
MEEGARLLTVSEAMTYLSMGRKKVVQYAKLTGAIYKIGRLIYIDKSIVDEDLRKRRNYEETG